MQTSPNRLKGKYVSHIYGDPFNCWQLRVKLDGKLYMLPVGEVRKLMRNVEFEAYRPPRCKYYRLQIVEKSYDKKTNAIRKTWGKGIEVSSPLHS